MKSLPFTIALALILIGYSSVRIYFLVLEILNLIWMWSVDTVWNSISLGLFVGCIGYILIVAIYLYRIEEKKKVNETGGKQYLN